MFYVILSSAGPTALYIHLIVLKIIGAAYIYDDMIDEKQLLYTVFCLGAWTVRG